MKKTRKLCAAMAVLLTVAVAAPLVTGNVGAEAAKKPKLSNAKLTIYVGSSKTLKVKNYSKKVTWKSSKESVAKLSSKKKTSVKISGKKKGSARVTAKYKLGKKTKTLTCTVTIRPKVVVETSAPVVTPTTAPIVVTPAPSTVPTIDPNATATPFPYDTYNGCLWKTDYTFKDTFADYFYSGISVGYADLAYLESAPLVKYHYNSISMGNETKMEVFFKDTPSTAHPLGMEHYNVENFYNGDGTPVVDMETLERSLKYCKENNLKMRLHTFVWHSQVQPWFFLRDYNWNTYDIDEYADMGWDEDNYHRLADYDTMKMRLNSYITQVIDYIYANGYGDVVYAYDVVNEAANGNLVYEFDVNTTETDPDKMAKKSSKSANTFVNGVYGIKMNGGVTTKSGKQVTYDSSASDVTDMCEFEGRVPDNSHSFWYATMDVNYIYLAFSDTYNAIKNAKEKYGAQFNYTVEPSLIYNDYSSYSTNTQIGLARWVNAAANAYNDTEDVMYCTGIGVQAHEGVGSNHEAMIKTYVESGFEVQITELDVGCKSGTGTWNYDGQASAYKRLYQTYMKYSGNEAFCKERGLPGVTSVTQWGLRDGDGSWRSDEAPYVFEPYTGTDKNLTIQPKPAFYAIFQAAGLDVGEKEY